MPVTKWFAAKDVLLFEVSLNTSQSSIAAVVFDRRATKHTAKFRAALRVGAAPAPRRVAGSLNRSSAIRLASALRVIRRRSQRCYTSLRLGALGRSHRFFPQPKSSAECTGVVSCSATRRQLFQFFDVASP